MPSSVWQRKTTPHVCWVHSLDLLFGIKTEFNRASKTFSRKYNVHMQSWMVQNVLKSSFNVRHAPSAFSRFSKRCSVPLVRSARPSSEAVFSTDLPLDGLVTGVSTTDMCRIPSLSISLMYLPGFASFAFIISFVFSRT